MYRVSHGAAVVRWNWPRPQRGRRCNRDPRRNPFMLQVQASDGGAYCGFRSLIISKIWSMRRVGREYSRAGSHSEQLAQGLVGQRRIIRCVRRAIYWWLFRGCKQAIVVTLVGTVSYPTADVGLTSHQSQRNRIRGAVLDVAR